MKLLVVTHVYPLNPHNPADIPGNFLPPFLTELVKLGTRVSVLAPAREGDQIPDDSVPVTRFRWWSKAEPLGRFNTRNPVDALRLANLFWRGTRALQELIRRERADVVLACWAVPAGVFAESAKRATGTPYVTWSLGSDIHSSPKNPLLRPLVVRSLKHAAKRYANAHVTAREVERLCGIDCDILQTMRKLPDAVPADLPRDRRNFLFAGRLERVKGADVLLSAFAKLEPEPVPPHLYLAGTGTEENALKAQARALNLENRVTFLGFLDGPALASCLRAVDAVVIPSRAESLPTILTEAAQCGAPVIATRVGEVGAVLERFRIGLLVAPENSDGLARAMVEMTHLERDSFHAEQARLLHEFDLTRAAKKLVDDLEIIVTRPVRSRQDND